MIAFIEAYAEMPFISQVGLALLPWMLGVAVHTVARNIITAIAAYSRRKRARALARLRNCEVEGVRYWWDHATRQQWAQRVGEDHAYVVEDRAQTAALAKNLKRL